jgi:hypothetical protein
MRDALYAEREFGKYSTEWDEAMNAELEVVRHAYFESIHPMDYRTIADYPRHGDTLRFGFRTLKDANAFLKDVLYRKALAETSYDRQAAQYYKDHPDATRSDF